MVDVWAVVRIRYTYAQLSRTKERYTSTEEEKAGMFDGQHGQGKTVDAWW